MVLLPHFKLYFLYLQKAVIMILRHSIAILFCTIFLAISVDVYAQNKTDNSTEMISELITRSTTSCRFIKKLGFIC